MLGRSLIAHGTNRGSCMFRDTGEIEELQRKIIKETKKNKS